MTKEDIKKALEFCDRDDYFFCGGCAYDNVRNCTDKLKIDALNLIIEQEKEIERLKEEKKQAQIDALNNVKDVLANQKHECLERNNLTGYSAICDCEKYIDIFIKEIENDQR